MIFFATQSLVFREIVLDRVSREARNHWACNEGASRGVLVFIAQHDGRPFGVITEPKRVCGRRCPSGERQTHGSCKMRKHPVGPLSQIMTRSLGRP